MKPGLEEQWWTHQGFVLQMFRLDEVTDLLWFKVNCVHFCIDLIKILARNFALLRLANRCVVGRISFCIA